MQLLDLVLHGDLVFGQHGDVVLHPLLLFDVLFSLVFELVGEFVFLSFAELVFGFQQVDLLLDLEAGLFLEEEVGFVGWWVLVLVVGGVPELGADGGFQGLDRAEVVVVGVLGVFVGGAVGEVVPVGGSAGRVIRVVVASGGFG